MSETVLDVSMPWYRTLNRDQWRVLLASNLGWLFDGFEIYALFLTVGFALHRRNMPKLHAMPVTFSQRQCSAGRLAA